MGFNEGANLYVGSFGMKPENVEVPTYRTRNPAATDVNFPLGKRWINYIGNLEYTLTSLSTANGITVATWVLSGGSNADLSALSLTATNGNITVNNGNFVHNTAGSKDVYTSVASTTTAGANSAGTVPLVAGTATVNTTAVTANSFIRLTCQALGTVAVPSALCVSTKVASTSFTILASDNTDTSTIFWEIVN